MRSMANRQTRTKRVTPQDQIKQLQKNIQEMQDKYTNDIIEMQKRFELENQQQLDIILESGEFIMMANEYEQKLNELQQQKDELEQNELFNEENQNQQKLEMDKLKQQVRDLIQWKPTNIDYFKEQEIPNYDGLLLRYINTQQNLQEELEKVKQNGIQAIINKDQQIADLDKQNELHNQEKQEHENILIQKQKQYQEQHDQIAQLQIQVQQLTDQLKQKEKQISLEKEMIQQISDNLEKNPHVGLMKREYQEKLDSQERIIKSLKEQNFIEIDHYKQIIEQNRQEVKDMQQRFEELEKFNADLIMQKKDNSTLLKNIIDQFQYQQRAPLKKLLSQIEGKNYEQDKTDYNEVQGQEYISDFQDINNQEIENINQLKKNQSDEYEIVNRKNKQIIIKKKRQNGVKYQQLIVEANGKQLIVNKSENIEQEGIQQDINEDISKLENLKQQIQPILNQEQIKDLNLQILNMEQKCRIQQQIYLQKILDKKEYQCFDQNDRNQNDYYIDILQVKEQEIDRLQLLLNQKQRETLAKMDLEMKLSNRDISNKDKDYITELKVNHKEILEQNEILQQNYKKMKDFYINEIRKVQQDLCNKNRQNLDNEDNNNLKQDNIYLQNQNYTYEKQYEISPKKQNRQISILQNKIQEQEDKNEQISEENNRFKLQNKRLKQHNQRIQEEIKWVRENYNQVLKNNLKLSQQLSQILGQITKSSHNQKEEDNEAIMDLKRKIQ